MKLFIMIYISVFANENNEIFCNSPSLFKFSVIVIMITYIIISDCPNNMLNIAFGPNVCHRYPVCAVHVHGG